MTERPLIVDTETTGLDCESDALLEVGWAELAQDGEQGSSFVRYDGRIPAVAQAVHHITHEDVVGAPLRTTIADRLVALAPTLVVAHNAEFDRGFLPEFHALPWLCTWRCARHLWPEAPSHSVQVLRYWLGLKIDTPAELAPHRALYDVVVTREILRVMLGVRTLQELIVLQDQPVMLTTIPFGKHRGQRWNTVPRDYLAWLLRQPDLDRDVRHTAEAHR